MTLMGFASKVWSTHSIWTPKLQAQTLCQSSILHLSRCAMQWSNQAQLCAKTAPVSTARTGNAFLFLAAASAFPATWKIFGN